MNAARWSLFVALAFLGAACPRGKAPRQDQPTSSSVTPAAARVPAAPARRALPAKPDPDALPPADGAVPAERRALQVVAGEERVVDAELARQRQLTIVDLSDDWSPAVFADGTAADGSLLPNRYRAVFVGLSNDRMDGDGLPLQPGEKNYLEQYGVPPSLSVLRARFLADADRGCSEVDRARLLAVDEIPSWGATTEKQELAQQRLRGMRLEAARVKVGVDTLEALAAADPRYAKDLQKLQRFDQERAALAEVEKRMLCEGMDASKHKPGLYDGALRRAVLDFQQRHTIMDQADLRRSTLEAMAERPLVLDLLALRRVLAERAAHAGGILEDGSVGNATYPTESGRQPVPDLVTAATEALMQRLGIETAEDALAFFQRHPASDFASLRVAVRFPEVPEYYGPRMDLSAEIDRGDVWYDFPFNSTGVRLPQPRERYPSFTLFVRWRGEKVPLVRWRTTIGSWRVELAADGQEYYRYKESDVGPRVWRHMVAAPVWIPPATSPLGSMVKEKRINGAFAKVTNYDETGPGYLSAYGLVAAIHEKIHRRANGSATYFDNGIRTHGSSDYLSLRGRFSHGCHRLYNNLAVRLFSFVLGHRNVKVLGPMALNARRHFWAQGEIFDMRLPTRGFYFELDPPMNVDTLKGRIKGARQSPLSGYVRKPGARYAAHEAAPAALDAEGAKQ